MALDPLRRGIFHHYQLGCAIVTVFMLFFITSPGFGLAQSPTADANRATTRAVLDELFSMMGRMDPKDYRAALTLDGSPIQKIVFNGRFFQPIGFFFGDELTYRIDDGWYPGRDVNPKPLLLIVKGLSDEKRFPLLMNNRLNRIQLPLSPAEPLKMYIENLYQLQECRIEILIPSANPGQARQKFNDLIRQTPLSNTARQVYKRTSGTRLRLRSEPNLNGHILRHLKKGTIFKIIEENYGWYKVNLPGGQTGWLSKTYVEGIP